MIKISRTIVLLCLLVAFDGIAASPCNKAACSEVRAQIREVEAKMRSGYTRAQGERYEARLRRLKNKRFRVCR